MRNYKTGKNTPKVINPLSVSVNSKGKKRLILDLRYVNDHLYKEKIKFDDWKYFENYLQANKGYLFKFDLKKRLPPHRYISATPTVSWFILGF